MYIIPGYRIESIHLIHLQPSLAVTGLALWTETKLMARMHNHAARHRGTEFYYEDGTGRSSLTFNFSDRDDGERPDPPPHRYFCVLGVSTGDGRCCCSQCSQQVSICYGRHLGAQRMKTIIQCTEADSTYAIGEADSFLQPLMAAGRTA
jgi:hypothetical protein